MGLTAAALAIFVSSYIFASVPWGLLIGLCKGVDIRREGSGNIGATNVTRVLGKKWGRICFALDFLKGFLPAFVVSILVARGVVPGDWQLALIAAIFGAVFGHVWSVFLKFKGGKGVATSAGAIMAVAPVPTVLSLLVWAAVFQYFKYVSLASICAAVFLPLSGFALSFFGLVPAPLAILLVLTLIAVLTVVKHKSNIRRLLDGTESRFTKGGGANA